MSRFRVLMVMGMVGCTCNRVDETTLNRTRHVGEIELKKTQRPMNAAPLERMKVGVWMLDVRKMEAGDQDPFVRVEREVGLRNPARNALAMLFQPARPEDAGLTVIRSGATGFESFELVQGVATVKLQGGCKHEGGTVTIYDHIRRTLSGFEDIKVVKVLDPEGQTQDAAGPADSRPACLEP